ncbi:hypothetical protein [Flavobacterium sp. N2038]|uniref:hypothetical protein n=1 Tax=Flavobacterium sp. N2038 TaxID=2986829 RepID=UPI002225A912|nr:hypothetical protein [Flavobacterium sp. N2038]
MKHKIYLIIMILTSHFLSAQLIHHSKEEKEAFLLGMFNHYNGDVLIPEHPVLKNRLTFFLNKKVIKTFKDSISCYALENNFKYIFKNDSFTELYKLEDNNPFEKYYKRKRWTKDFYFDEKDDKQYKLYFLQLDRKAFKRDGVRMAFLLGAFINNGKIINDNEYSFVGSTVFIDFIIDLLRDLKIEIIETEISNKKTLGGMKEVKFSPLNEFKNLVARNKKFWE